MPRGNEKWPTCQCALSHRDKSHAGGRKHWGALPFLLEENSWRKISRMRECSPNPLRCSLTVDDGKLEKYRIEFGSWRTVIKSFEFLPLSIFLFSRIGTNRSLSPPPPRILYSYNTPRLPCLKNFPSVVSKDITLSFRKIKDLGREGKFKAHKGTKSDIYNFSKIVALNSFGIFIPAKSCVEQRARGLTGKRERRKKRKRKEEKKKRSVFNFAVAA